MIDITKAEVDILVQLQKAETETVHIESFLNDVEKEKSILESKLTDFQSALNKLKSDFDLIAKACFDAELEIKLNDDRIEKSSANLKKANSKDYPLLQREIDNNKKRRETLENLYLKHLEEKESQEKVLKEQEQLFVQLTQQIRSEQENIDNKSLTDRERLAEHRVKREEIARTLNKHLLSRFNEISEASGGLAVVEVRDELCRGCFMNIPPQLYIEVRRSTYLIQCPHCNKILYHIETLSQ
ncbi:MAG: nucleotide-binding protein [Desulfamplus sp.]|nr:nucleotide-binding protein [Desulfamplus sp.]